MNGMMNAAFHVLLSVSVFVSHAVADGYHTCKLINDIQEIGRSLAI